jgi:hypothetical protein
MPADLPRDFAPDVRFAPPDFALVEDDARAGERPFDAFVRDLDDEAVERDFEPDDFFDAADFFEADDFFADDLPPPALAREDDARLPPLPPDGRRAEPLDLAFAMKPPDLFDDVVIAGCITAAGGKGIFSGRSAQVAPPAEVGETSRRAPRRTV